MATALRLFTLVSVALPALATEVAVGNRQVAFVIDTSRGVVRRGLVRDGERVVVAECGGSYRVGEPVAPDSEQVGPVTVLDEGDDRLAPGSLRVNDTVGFESVAGRYTNPGLPEVVIEKRYSLAPGSRFLVKKIAFLPSRDRVAGIEYSLDIKLDPAFRDGSYYHCPMGIHFGQRVPTWMRAEQVTEPVSLSGKPETGVAAEHGLHAFVVCANPRLDLAAASWRAAVNGKFVRPSWSSTLGSGIFFEPDGWRMGVYAEYLGRPSSAEVHLGLIRGDHLTAHRLWQQLPGWQAIVRDGEVANGRSPAWLDRVKVMALNCEGIAGPLQVRDNYARLVNEGVPMIMLAGCGVTVWSGNGPVGTVYLADGALYQKSDHRQIHDAAWFRAFVERIRAVSPRARIGFYFLMPEVTIKRNTGPGATALSWWQGLDLPRDLSYIRDQWRTAMAAHGADFIYMDGAPEYGGAIDYRRKLAWHNDLSLAVDRAVRRAARSLGEDKVYWRNSEVNVYTDCGFAELSGFGNWHNMAEQTGWRNVADRLLKVKLYERPGKWVAPLYANATAEYANYALGLGARPWGIGPCALVNAVYEVRNLRLLEADVRPCWWRDYGEVEAHGLSLGASRVLSAINHEDGPPRTVTLSADAGRLGVPSDRPMYVWECARTEDNTTTALSDFVVQDVWRRHRWARGVAVRRRLVAVAPLAGPRFEHALELPYNALRQVVLSPVPALVYAAHGYRRAYPLTDFCGHVLRGRVEAGLRRLAVTAEIPEAAEIALVAPAEQRFEGVTLDGRAVAFETVAEDGATLAVVTVPAGKHHLIGACSVAPPTAFELVGAPGGRTARYLPGVEGQGLYLGESSRLVYPDRGPWDLNRGTIELAVRPDYADQGETSHILVGLAGREFSFHLYKLLRHDGLCFNLHAAGRDHPLHAPQARWSPGTWHRVKVSWDTGTGRIALSFDGQPAGEVTRPMPRLGPWTGEVVLGRNTNDTWIGAAAFDQVTVTADGQVAMRLPFDGHATDAAGGAAGEPLTVMAAGETLPLSFTLRAEQPWPKSAAPYLRLTRDGSHVTQRRLPATARAGSLVVTDAPLRLPDEAEGGTYLVWVGVPGLAAPWRELARVRVTPKPAARNLLRRDERPLTATFDGHPLTRLWSHESYGAEDPSCRASFDPATATFTLAAGTGYDSGGAVAAGVELNGLTRLGIELLETDDVAQPRPGLYVRRERGPESLSGLVLDFGSDRGYRRRVVCGLGVLTRRASPFPDWGWAKAADREPLTLIDLTGGKLGEPRRLRLDLAPLAPTDWDGRLVVSTVLQQCLLTTTLRVRILPSAETARLPAADTKPLDLNPLVRVTPVAPVIDGRLEDSWRELAALSPFYELGGIRRAAPATVAYIGRDAEALYLAVDCRDAQVVPGDVGQDAPTWRADDVEVFVQPDGADYYQFAVNPAGGRYDGRRLDSRWTGAWTAACARTAGGWSAELRLPFVLFGGPPAPGARWRVAIGRNDAGGGAGGLSAWPVFARRDFHLPESFAPMVFE